MRRPLLTIAGCALATAPAAANDDPLQFGYHLQELSARADSARDAGDHAAAVEHYRELARAVPDHSVAFARLCESYQALGRRDEALASCRDALGRRGAQVADHVRFGRLVLAAPGELAARDVADLDAAIAHLVTHDAGRLAAYHLQCELGVRLADERRLTACTTGLTSIAPDDPKTITFQWALALQRDDHAAAAKLVERARRTAMAPAGVAAMERATAAAGGARSRSGYGWWAIAAVAIVAGVAVVGVRGRRSR